MWSPLAWCPASCKFVVASHAPPFFKIAMGIASLLNQRTWDEGPLRAKIGGVSRQFDHARRIRELALDPDDSVYFGLCLIPRRSTPL